MIRALREKNELPSYLIDTIGEKFVKMILGILKISRLFMLLSFIIVMLRKEER